MKKLLLVHRKLACFDNGFTCQVLAKYICCQLWALCMIPRPLPNALTCRALSLVVGSRLASRRKCWPMTPSDSPPWLLGLALLGLRDATWSCSDPEYLYHQNHSFELQRLSGACRLAERILYSERAT